MRPLEEPDYLPDSLPLHFRLDVACLKLGAAEGQFAKADVRLIPDSLEREWRRLRTMQERKWATKPKDDMHFELIRAIRIHGANLHEVYSRVTSGARGMLRDCIRVVRLQLGPKRELTDVDLDNFPGRLSIEAIVDLAGDPLMADLNFVGPTTFKLLLEVYERYLQAPDAYDPKVPTCELRFAHIAHYDYVLLFPPQPYAKCALPEPDKHECVAAAFPVDTEVQGAMHHQEKMMVAHATLTSLFWQCFNAMFPVDASLTSPSPRGEGVAGACSLAEAVRLPVSVVAPIRRRGFRKSGRLRECTSREEAMGILWSIMRPTDFRFPLYRTQKVREKNIRGIIDAVQIAIHDAAQELECKHGEFMPTSWNSTPDDHNALIWPLLVLSVNAQNKSNSSQRTDDGLRRMMPLVALDGELASLDYQAVMRTEVQDMDMEEEPCETVEDKELTVVLDLGHLEERGEVTVMQITGTSHMEIQEALELMSQLEECVLERGNEALIRKASQVAYGLRALQRASIKQQLRDVGLTVVETVRPVQFQTASGSLCDCCCFLCALCKFWCCCRRQRASQMSKVAADDEHKMRRIMFVSAPDLVLQQRAEMHKMVLKVCPNRFKTFIGGFVEAQFLRKAPSQEFWVEIPTDPYPYKPYFAPSLPSADPASILSPAERKYLVRSFITDPMSDVRFPDGAIDPRRGGADMDPSELVSEDILDGFLCLGSTLLGNHLVETFILRWRRYGLYEFIRNGSLFSVPSQTLLRNWGPQIASYFEFLSFTAKALVVPALLGCFALYSGAPNAKADGAHPFWKYVQPIFSLVMVLWGVIFVVGWRRRAAKLGYLWHNGITQMGEEVNSSTKLFGGQKDLRVEFAMKYRKEFDRSSPEKQRNILSTLRKVLRVSDGSDYFSSNVDNLASDAQFQNQVPMAPSTNNVVTSNHSASTQSRPLLVFQSAFGYKRLRGDIDSYSEVCYMPTWERRRRILLGALASFCCVALCFVITFFSLTIQRILQEMNAESDDLVNENSLLSYTVSGVTSGLLIPVLNIVHRHVAMALTEWEGYRHKRDHEVSVFYKLFIFEFVNYFNGLFLVAFKYQNMTQLRVQVASILVSMTIAGNIREVIMPMLLQDVKRVGEMSPGQNGSGQGGAIGRSLRQVSDQWGRPDDFVLVDEVIELVLQFGLVTMFSVAFPGLPLIWLLSTCLELRVDAYKLIRLLKTPEPYNKVGIGVAYNAFQFIAVVAVFVNCALLMFTRYTDYDGDVLVGSGVEVLFPDEDFRFHMRWVVAIEHIMLAVTYIIINMVPTLSSEVREDAFRQQYYDKREDAEYRRDEDEAVSTKTLQAQHRRRRHAAARRALHTPRAAAPMNGSGKSSIPFKGVTGPAEPCFFPVTTDTAEVSAAASASTIRLPVPAAVDGAAQSAESAPLMGDGKTRTAESARELVLESPYSGE